MDAENNPESPDQDIEFLEDDFVEVVDLDDENETSEGTPCSFINKVHVEIIHAIHAF